MNRDADVEKFWNLIERKMTIIFPNYLRNILKLRGYDNAVSVKSITEDDIEQNFEKFAKTTMKDRMPKNANFEDYFSNYAGPDDFEIIPGHKIILMEVVEYVKEMTRLNGKDYFNFYTSIDVSSQPLLSKRAMHVSRSKMSTAPRNVSSDEDEVEKENVDRVKEEQLNLVKRIKAWLQKHVDTASEKYSDAINVSMVHVVFKDDIESNVRKLGASITCLICTDAIRISEMRKVLVNGTVQTYLTASNYTSHLKIHKNKNEFGRVLQNQPGGESSSNNNTKSRKPLKEVTESLLDTSPRKTSTQRGSEKHKKILNRILAQKQVQTQSAFPQNRLNQLARNSSHKAISQPSDSTFFQRTFANNDKETTDLDRDTHNDHSDYCIDDDYHSEEVAESNPSLKGPHTTGANVKDRMWKKADPSTYLHSESANFKTLQNQVVAFPTKGRDEKVFKRPAIKIIDVDLETDSSGSYQETDLQITPKVALSEPSFERPNTSSQAEIQDFDHKGTKSVSKLKRKLSKTILEHKSNSNEDLSSNTDTNTSIKTKRKKKARKTSKRLQIASTNEYESDEDFGDEEANEDDTVVREDNNHDFQAEEKKNKRRRSKKIKNKIRRSNACQEESEKDNEPVALNTSNKQQKKFKRRSNLRSVATGAEKAVAIREEYLCAECGKKYNVRGSEILNQQNAENPNKNIFLNALLDSAVKNGPRKKSGYRHSDIIKMFAGFIKMIAGLLAYETLHANLPLCIPSPSTIDRFIKDNGPSIIEGEPRIDELVEYLTVRNLPSKVSLSEDATRVTAKISYDPNTNQLVGFALPLDDNSMPIPFTFKARNAKEIESHFKNPLNNISSLVYVQMIQPQMQNVPPFCLNLFLSDNAFKAESVRKRWNFLKKQLLKKKIIVDNFASDGDPRYLKAMKAMSKLGVHDQLFLKGCEWFSCGKSLNETYVQDPIHVGCKLRCRVLKVSRITPLGQKLISISHLQYLIDNISKDKHLLTLHDIEPKDKQNFKSVEKICSLKTIECMLKNVPGSEATAMYLKAMNYALDPYLKPEMEIEERIYKIWYSLFFFRIWRSFIIKKSVPKFSTTLMEKYTLKECFISSNCYTCLELNAHSLIKQIIKCNMEKSNSGSDNEIVNTSLENQFIPNLLDSQPCESLFRQMRSFTSTFSTVVNCTMLDSIHRIRKLQVQSDIINSCSGLIKFPRLEKKNEGTYPIKPYFITENAIISEIERAKTDVSDELIKLGIFKKSEIKWLNFQCQIKPERKADLQNDSGLCDHDSDSDFLSDSDIECDIEQSKNEERSVTLDNSFIDEESEMEEEMNKLSSLTGELFLRDYSETKLNLEEKSPFAIVVDSTGKESVVRKSSICWLLSKDKHKISSDRLQRVKEKEFDQNSSGLDQNKSLTSNLLLLQNDEIYIGDWCVFETNNNLRLGLVLSFSYLTGNTLKSKEYTKSLAPVLVPAQSMNIKGIGVLCSWYSWDSQGSLTGIIEMNHSFLKIENYKGTIQKPLYTDHNLSISYDLIQILENMKRSIENSEESRFEGLDESSIRESLGETQVSVMDYVICAFETLCKTVRLFVGQVRSIRTSIEDNLEAHQRDESLDEKEYEIKFLRKSGNTFVYPNVEDIAYVQLNNIIHTLKNPSKTRRNAVTFDDPEIMKFDLK